MQPSRLEKRIEVIILL